MTNKPLLVAVAAALCVLAIAAPLAAARPAADSRADRVAYSSDAGGSAVIVSDDPGATISRSIDDGFDWGAAGIGAGAFLIVFTALGLVTLRPGARHSVRLH